MSVYNLNIKTTYLDPFENEETKEVYTRLFRKAYETETKFGKDLFDFNEDDWEYFFKNILRPRTKESARSYCNVLANYVQWAIDNNHSQLLINPLKRRQEYFFEFVQERKTYFSYAEKEAILSTLVNKQDSFIIEALWNGIQGTKVNELANLKIDDIDIKNRKISLRNDKGEIVRVVNVDKNDTSLIEMAILANQEKEYYRLNGEADYTANLKDTVELAPSEYVLKSAITMHKGLPRGGQRVSHHTIYNRLDMVRSLEEMEEYKDALVSKNIVRSGMIYMALSLYERDGQIERAQIEEICNKYNMKYKWSLRDFLNVDVLKELYPSEMKEINQKISERKIAMDN
ncbi:site-specific integrase [Paenibacillus sp. Mc5Re-14]|uniref:tyrosine-type recombinase/integrase n=1 Tax=Paenibacillus sp. Mc5Re-14 TaxID=1030529 RepID=UPI000A53290D|nr:site-specific integrase [Paenibacillus sp. Mc5Re-14]